MKKPKTYSTQLLNVTYNITIQDPPLPSCIDVLKRGRWGEIQFILLSNECFMFLVHWDFYLMLAVISPPFFIKCSVQMFNSHQKNIVVISMWWWILRLSLDGHGGGSWKWMWCDMNVWSKCVPIVWLFVNPLLISGMPIISCDALCLSFLFLCYHNPSNKPTNNMNNNTYSWTTPKYNTTSSSLVVVVRPSHLDDDEDRMHYGPQSHNNQSNHSMNDLQLDGIPEDFYPELFDGQSFTGN